MTTLGLIWSRTHTVANLRVVKNCFSEPSALTIRGVGVTISLIGGDFDSLVKDEEEDEGPRAR
jgi:hypothetical protein